MNFEGRVAKEMTEGIVKAILEDAGYRVIDSGIEKLIRELSCLSNLEYGALNYPAAMRRLPDFTVMNREQTEKFLVEVKYRSQWGMSLLQEVREQVELFGELVLVSVNAKPDNKLNLYLPSTYLRCCRLRMRDSQYQVQLKYENDQGWNHYWKAVDELQAEAYLDATLWWGMSPLDRVFTLLEEDRMETRQVLYKAIQSLSGILTLPEP
jgi:hypothetical protein